MTSAQGQAREDQFLGALLGMAIGDAMGRPFRGWTGNEILPLLADPLDYAPDPDLPANEASGGEITDKTEIALCLVESLTTNGGHPDPDNMVARMGFLAAGPSKQFMSSGTISGIELAIDQDGQVPADHSPPAELAVASRGVPIGLLHAVGGFDSNALQQDAVTVTRLSHAGTEQEHLTIAVAQATAFVGRTRSVQAAGLTGEGKTWDAFRALLVAVEVAESFAGGLRQAVAQGGATDSVGAIAGALLGTRFGASAIPQALIDNLDARIYLTLAAPWFYRTAVMRAGTVIDLRHIP